MRLSLLIAACLAVLATAAAPAFAAGTDEPPKPAPKPPPKSEPKPEPKPDSKDAPKAIDPAAFDADYVAGKSAIDAHDWKRAIDLFSRAATRNAGNANIETYLGFANRNDGNWDEAMRHYRTALAIDPMHRGANEYLGHAYLIRGNMRLAEGQLAKLERICGRGCEQYASLSQAVEEYRRNPR